MDVGLPSIKDFRNGWRFEPTTPQYPKCVLRLLPSGPDRVHKLPSPRGPALTAIINRGMKVYHGAMFAVTAWERRN